MYVCALTLAPARGDGDSNETRMGARCTYRATAVEDQEERLF